MFISSLILLKFIFHQLYKIKHLEKIGIMSNNLNRPAKKHPQHQVPPILPVAHRHKDYLIDSLLGSFYQD